MKIDTKKKIVGAVLAVKGLAVTGQLTIDQIIRAWESPEYRQTLSAEQLKQLPENPAGTIESQLTFGTSFQIASTTVSGCSTTVSGCSTTVSGCSTTVSGCSTTVSGCSTQSGECMEFKTGPAFEIASTSGYGCSTSGYGCETSGYGCSTSGYGCETSGYGCSTQFSECMG